MQTKMRALIGSLAMAGALALVAGPLAAQSIPAADGAAVMGSWSLDVDDGMGSTLTLYIDVTEADGQVAATVGSDMMPQTEEVTRISRAGETVTLAFTADAQGQILPVEIALTPSGDDLSAEISAADGMFVAQGTAVRAE